MNDFKFEFKLFLIVAAVAVLIAVGGILLLQQQAGLGPSSPTPAVQTPPPAPSPKPQPVGIWTRYTDYRSDQQKVTEYLRENITDMVKSDSVLRMPRLFIHEVEFYEGNKVIATFIDDNRVVGFLLGKYSVEDGRAQVVYLDETFEKQDAASLDELKQKYGFTELDTSSWQAYRNKEYGFEFLRPVLNPIHVSVLKEEASFDEFVAKLSRGWEQDSKEVMVAGVPAVQGVRPYGGESGAWHLVTYIDLTPKAIISLGTFTGPEVSKEELQQYEKVFSTFRFIDLDNLSFLEDSFSAWGTYEGRLDLEIPRDYTRRDFKFDYPLNWVVDEVFRNVFISTFTDGYTPDIYSDLLKISSDQGLAVISVKPKDKSCGYSLDEWIDSGLELSDDYVALERSVIPGIEYENRLIRYEVPKLGVEGRDAYVISTQGCSQNWGAEVIYVFHLEYNQADQMANIYERVFDQILATFRFVEE